jgi:hypothetical protein
VPKSSGRRKPPGRPRPVSTRTAAARAARQPLVPQPAPGLRGKVERASAPILVWLSSKPKLLIPVLSAALLLGGLAAPDAVGIPLLVLLLLLVGWLSYLSWPVVQGAQKVVRLATVGLVLAALIMRFIR